MLTLLREFNPDSVFIQRLAELRKLPLDGYSDRQWHLLESLIKLLPILVGELWLVFRAHGQADFAEIALKANQALGGADDPSDLLLKIDHDLHHILVDEFQDTSRQQYQLLNTLTSGWSAGDGRTLFLVGDPMQSIYRFREAEVGLFLHCYNGVFGEAGIRLQPLQLNCNFRSQQGIVSWVNNTFKTIFPVAMNAATGSVPLSQAVAVKPPLSGYACQVFPFIGSNDHAEALKVVELVQRRQKEDPEQTIAILVRGRSHLSEILPLLRLNNIRYQAQDIDQLGARSAALDVVHLTRALLHRADRLSWLAVLRAPWCGLTLEDLYILVGQHPQLNIPSLLSDEKLKNRLSADGQLRLARVWPVLQAALRRRGSISLRQLVENCWLAIGGPASVTSAGCSDAQMVFDLLDDNDKGGDLKSFEKLDRDLMKLFAEPDNHADSKLQIMTIHKAKGLEFDTVIIPGLGKSTGRTDNPLLRWQEHPEYGLLLAPVTARGSQEQDPIYQLIAHLEKEKQDLETGRLLYVATTRAVNRLYLLGHADENSRGELKPRSGSLLEKLWPLMQETFQTGETKTETSGVELRPPQLQRLASGWVVPASQSAHLPTPKKTTIASSRAETDKIFSGWENPVHRHVGTLVHSLLEQIASSGVDVWLKKDKDFIKNRMERTLIQYGVISSDLAAGVQRASEAINMTLASSRGRWILNEHPDQGCELPLTGMVQGELVRSVIDRTFVAEGYRWIIDYKTSTPRDGESLEDFLRREAEHYRDQLNTYVSLLSQQRGQFPIKAALYFPLLDGWHEY